MTKRKDGTHTGSPLVAFRVDEETQQILENQKGEKSHYIRNAIKHFHEFLKKSPR